MSPIHIGRWLSLGAEKHRTEEKNNDIIIRYGDFSSFLDNTGMPISVVYVNGGQGEWTHPQISSNAVKRKF